MGLDIYYRRFIELLSKVVHPITSLQKKGTKFEWTTKCEESFQHLKELSTSAPILKVSYLDEDFVVWKDPCKEGLVESLHKVGMPYVMSKGRLNNMKKIMLPMT